MFEIALQAGSGSHLTQPKPFGQILDDLIRPY